MTKELVNFSYLEKSNAYASMIGDTNQIIGLQCVAGVEHTDGTCTLECDFGEQGRSIITLDKNSGRFIRNQIIEARNCFDYR